MASRVTRTTTSAALLLAVLAPGVARADDAAGHYNLCVQFKREAKLTEAVGECLKALKLRSNYAAAHMTLGSLYRAQNNYAGAAAEYENRRQARAEGRARPLQPGRRLPGAQAHRRRARELEEGDGPASRRLRDPRLAGQDLQQEGRLQARDGAPGEGDRAEARPDVDAWNSLGIARSKTDDKEGAIVAFNKAISLRPDDAELHFGLATVYRRQRNTDKAIAEYQVAVQKNPRLAKAYYDLGLLYAQDKKNAEARQAFEKYLQYGTNEDAASRKDAEERLKTYKK
jgi:tetratricopeptide (TPR) repeat protein